LLIIYCLEFLANSGCTLTVYLPIYPLLLIEYVMFLTQLLDALIIFMLVKETETDGCDQGI